MSLRVVQIQFHRLTMRTRFPFRYGIASMTELPHLFVVARVHCDGRTANGMSADGLPPKWFTKNPDTRFDDDDLPQMLRVIRQASSIAMELKDQPDLFSWWWQLYQGQQTWARRQEVASLLAGLGVSLVERAVIDAVCRIQQTTLFQSLQTNAWGIDLGAIRPSLAAMQPADCLPNTPAGRVMVRHTVGLGDPLADADVDSASDPQDGLPYSLESSLRHYGLRFLKIKLCGDPSQDEERLARLAEVVQRSAPADIRVTLDGNEQYRDIDAFRGHWELLRHHHQVREFLDRHMLFVEQPLHRDQALAESVAGRLRQWPDAPPIIIDESDAALDSLPTAL
ncbi:MAG: hypothetical protein MI861_17960, partial [Pirellulales bacterium]|nr:hypothetical protein [Pirellulales bacterium]